MVRLSPSRALAGALLMLGAATLGACDNAATDAADGPSEMDALLNAVVGTGGLTAAQQARVGAAFGAHRGGRPAPGYAWIVADSLRRILTAEQKAALLARTDSADAFRGLHGHPGGGFYGVGGFVGSDRRHGASGADSVLNLTDAQRAQVQAIHAAHRDSVRALRTARRAGTLTDEAFLRAMLALARSLEADVLAVLTDAQRTALAAYRATREAAFNACRAEVTAVRDRVLGLTAAQSAAFDALLAEQLAAREVLVERFATGALTLAQYGSEVRSLLAAKATALQALLSDEQYETTRLHDALATRGHGKGRHGKGGPGGGHGNGGGRR